MFDFIDKGLEKFKQTVAQAAQSVAPTVQNLQNSYVNAYQKASPYIPLAPRFLNSQQAQQNFQPFINDFNKGFSNPQSYNDNFTQAPIGQQIGATTRPLYDALNTAGSPFKPLMQSAQDFSQRPNPIAAAQVGLNTLGLAKMTPTGYALNTAFGAGINKIFNPQQSFTQSLQQGSEGAPLLSGVGALVNPVEEGITGALSSKLLPKGVNSLKQAAIEKGIAGVGQVPFGATLRAVSGQNPVDPMGVAGDIAFGSAGKYLDDRFQPKVKGTIGRTPNLLDPEDAGYYYRALDILKDKKATPDQINQAKQVLFNLGEKYISPGNRPESGGIDAIIKAIDEKAGKSHVYYGNSPFMMGVYSNGEYKNPYTRGDISKIESDLDALIGTDQYRMNGKFTSTLPARKTAFEALEYEAQNNPEAQTVLQQANKLQDQLEQAKIDKNLNVVPTKNTTAVQPTVPNNEIWLRQGAMESKNGGHYFSTPGESTYYDVENPNAKKFIPQDVKLVASDTPEAGNVLKEALKNKSNTPEDIQRIQQAIEGNNFIDYRLNDEVPSVVKAAKKLGYDGIKVWENDDISNPSSVFLWNTAKVKEQPDVNPNYTPITLKDGEVQPLDPKENLKQLLQLPTQKGESVAQKRGKTLSEDPFIRELEQEKLKQEDVGMGQSTNPNPQVNTPTINTDKSTQYEANIKGGGFDKIDPQVKQDFADWVNQRRATQVEGLLKKQQFSDLDSKGIQGIFEFQSGSKEGRYGDVKKYFDSKYQDIKDTGLDLNYKSDYLPQLWANSREEVEQKLGRSLGTNPSFSFESLIKNYKEGIEKNLTPRFNTVSDLVGWYERTANKAIADRNYFTKLATDGLIQPASKAPRDWITIDPDRFPKVKVKVAGEGSYVGTYKAPQELGTMINNYLKDPQHGFMNAIANFVSGAKNRTLSFGVPGTGINAHGINILARHTLFGTGGNPITRFITGSQYMLNPGSAESVLTKNLSHAGDAVKNGLTLSTEDNNALLNEAENVATKFGKQWNNYFEKPLFGKMIPALKLSSYQELIKNGMDGKDAAKLVNNVYGGINWEQLGRNRDTQNLMRAIILAPDWAESTLRLGGNIAKSLTPFGGATGARYRAMAATLLGSYIAANVANKISSGHYMYENDTGHTFEIEAGFTGDGQKRYIRPYGTAVDFVRLPVDILQGLLRGDPSAAFRAFSNRLSIPLSAASHLLFNVDYKGNPIYGKTVSGLQAAGGIGSELAGMAGTPSFIKNIADTATGKQGVEQGLTQSLELPLRYSGGEATKKIVTQLQAKNTSNQDINQQLQNMYQRSQNKQDVLQNISPEVKQALASIDQIKKLDPNDPQRKAAEALLFKLYPQAFAAQQQLAYLNSNNNENLVDPLYRHGNEQVAQKLLTYNSLPPSSAEKKQYYKNNADLGAFEEQRVNWQKQNPYTGSGNGFSYNPPPQPNNYVLQQMAAKNFNDPQVQQYLQDKNVYDNQQRQKWGLDTVDSYGNIQGSKNFGVSFSKGSSYALRRLKSQVNRPVKARKLKTSKPKMAKLRIKTAKLAKVKPLKLKV